LIGRPWPAPRRWTFLEAPGGYLRHRGLDGTAGDRLRLEAFDDAGARCIIASLPLGILEYRNRAFAEVEGVTLPAVAGNIGEPARQRHAFLRHDGL
jgi:hypothetical protein